MSIAPQKRQNEYTMSNHRYKSNGLADSKLSETSSINRIQHTDNVKPPPRPENPPPPFDSSKCSQNETISKETLQQTPEKTPEGSIKKETSSNIAVNTSHTSQATNKDKDISVLPDSKSSSHSKVEQKQDKDKSYEEAAMNKIEKITTDIEEMYNKMHAIEKFEQISEFKMFEEFFLQKNIELDNIDPQNNEHIREFRKAAVKYVQDCMYNLDQKQKISGYE